MAGRLFIRADADGRIGTGHVMRCLALAAAWRAAGGEVIFVSRSAVAKLRGRIRAAGAGLVSLQRSHPDPGDLHATLDLLQRTLSDDSHPGPAWVVLDGYHFDSAYQQAIRAAGGRLLVIDDAAELPHFHAEVLLNQNAAAEEPTYTCNAEALLLLGSRYVLLRPEFHPWRSWRRKTPETARKLLVTLGGADPDNMTRTVLRALERLDLETWEAKVVVGPAHPHRKSLRKQLASTAGNIELLLDADQMPELMAWADLAISGAGTTCWELAWMQLPAVVAVLAENQAPLAGRLSEAGVVTNLGPCSGLSAERIAASVSALCRDRSRRVTKGRAGRRLVDGRGAERVVAVMEALGGLRSADQVRLRPVAAEDITSLWRLRNDPTVRRCALVSSNPIRWDEHRAWFEHKLASPDTRVWVLDFQGLAVGVIRYDRTDRHTAEISLHVAAAFRQRGLGTRLLEETRSRACHELRVDCLRALVRQENVPSARTFAKAGFAIVESRPVRSHPCRVFARAG